jgi:hypothetical protein
MHPLIQAMNLRKTLNAGKRLLGGVLRIHGIEAKLSALQNTPWLGGLSGYCQVSPEKYKPSLFSPNKNLIRRHFQSCFLFLLKQQIIGE